MRALPIRVAFVSALSLGFACSAGCAQSQRTDRFYATGGTTSTGGAGGTTTGTGGASTATGGTSAGGASTGKTWDFAADVSGWALKYSEPTTLLTDSTLSADAADGSPKPGSLKLEIPFSDVSQKVEAGVDLAGPIDMSGLTLSAEVKLDSGLTSDVNNPGGIKLYVKSGDAYLYADGGYINLDPAAGWFSIDLDLSAPQGFIDPNGTYNPKDIREVGVEVDTGAKGTYAPAVLHVDTVTY